VTALALLGLQEPVLELEGCKKELVEFLVVVDKTGLVVEVNQFLLMVQLGLGLRVLVVGVCKKEFEESLMGWG
jgi:hypothetical protein